jgi:hypothetical protein
VPVFYYVVTARLFGGPRDGAMITNKPPLPRDLVFDEALFDVPTIDPWARNRVDSYDFQGRHLAVTSHALSFARMHFYRADPTNDLRYVYIGWYSQRESN